MQVYYHPNNLLALLFVQDHLENCQYTTVPCGHCDHHFARSIVIKHRFTCRDLVDYDGTSFKPRYNGLQETARHSAAYYVDILTAKFRNLGINNDRMTAATTSVIELLRQNSGNNSALETLIQFYSRNGEKKWKISYYRELQDTTIYSAPFYTSENGYKMRLRLHLNGCKEGENSHLSLFLVVVKGEHDDVLPWPLANIRVLFTLLNMTDGANHTYEFSPEPFMKPIASSEFDGAEAGFSQFIGHRYVSPFITDNKIFVKCEVKER